MARGLDVPGTLAVIAAPILLVFGIVNASQEGWGSPLTLGCVALAVLIGVAFVLIEQRVAVPLVPLSIFRSRVVVVTNLVTMLSGASFFGWFFFSPQYAQHILGFDALRTGATFLPATLVMMVMSLGLAARVVSRFGPKRPLVLGMLLFGVGMLLLARAPVGGSFAVDLLGPMLLLGFSAGLSFMPLFLIATAEASAADSGLVSGLISMSQMIGGAIGLAVLAGVAAMRAGGAVTPEALNGGYQAAFLVAAVLSLGCAALAASQLEEPKVRAPEGAPALLG
jgi:MFS family permease